MLKRLFRGAVFTLATAALACAPTTPATTQPSRPAADSGPAQPSRTLRLVLRTEPASLSGVILIPANITTGTQRRLFNAGLALADGNQVPLPYLAEALPQLNTESWRVLPDGRMETTYRLKAGLTWHDGSPLSADDFVFAWRVYTTPDYGIAGAAPHGVMEDVRAPDQRTVVIRWSRVFPDAGNLWGFSGTGMESATFTPLPRHILEASSQVERETFANLPYWTTEYVGLGPYRLDRWEPGAFIEAGAFDGHALGRPKIDRIRLTFSPDFNATLANLLAGETDMPVDDSIRAQQGVVLKQEWATRGVGLVQFRPTLWRKTEVQLRPEVASPRAVFDLAVRKALTHAVDKQAINDSLFEGEGIVSDVPLIPPTESYYAELERAVPRYPFDLRRSEQLMSEGGYRKGSDGFYVSPAEGRLSFELTVLASPQNDAERSIMADGWRRAGFAIEEGGFSAAQSRDPQTLATFKALSSTSGPLGETAAVHQTSSAIPRAASRWLGWNRGAWSNAEYDRLYDAYQSTLDRTQRIQHLIAAMKVLNEDLGVLPLYFNPSVLAAPAALSGISVRSASAEMSWNVHQWELR